MFSINEMHPVVIEEKIKFNPQYLIRNSYFTMNNKKAMKFQLQRNIRDDTFNIMMPEFKAIDKHYDKSKSEYLGEYEKNSVSITANIDGNNNTLGYLPVMKPHGSETVPDKTYFIHRDAFNNSKLREIKSLTVSEESTTTNKPKGIFSLFPSAEEIEKTVRLKKGEYLDIRTINAVDFTVDINNVDRADHVAKVGDGIIVKKYYSHTILVPRKISRLEHNKTIFDIFITNDVSTVVGANKTENDSKLQDGKMTSSGFKKGFELTPKSLNGIDTSFINIKNGEQTKPKYVGSFKIFQHSSYDYEKQAGVIGSSATSEEGELIPFMYSGNYSRISTIGVNEIYKKIDVLQSILKTEAVLHPDSGRFMLRIKDDEKEINRTWNVIDQKLFKKDSDYIYPLKGLERLAALTEQENNEKNI